MPIVGVVVMAGGMALIYQGGRAWLFAIPMGAMAVVGVVASLLSVRDQNRQRARELAERQAFFEEQLAERHEQLRKLYEHERACRFYLNPNLDELLNIAGVQQPDLPPRPRLWERRLGDPDFLELRAGLGAMPTSVNINVPAPRQDGPVDRRLYEIAQRYSTLKNVPVAIPLGAIGSLGIAGPSATRQALFRALIWQAAVLHAPGELRIAVIYPQDAPAEQWDWLRWLPHTMPLSNEPARSQRMCASDEGAVTQLLSNLLDELSRRRDRLAQQRQTDGAAKVLFPTVLLVVDTIERVRHQPVISEIMRAGASINMALICLEEAWADIPTDCGSMIDLQAQNTARWARAGQQWSHEHFMIDQADLAASDALARRLAGLKLAESGGAQDVPRSVRLFDVLDIADEKDLRPPRFWQTPLEGAWHPDVPIGRKAGGEPLCLDLYEHKHGPHGIIAGTTGAGKSVLLQCIIASLAIKHSPVQMQLLLIDFKGGASLAMFEPLPHTAGFVTDLEGRMAERAMTAIKSEIRRRKTILRDTATATATKVENIHDYRALAKEHHLPPLPNLLIIIDEFDEMVKSYSDFVTELVRVVKQGRSLGVHLLVATQQPAKAVSDEIRTQLKFFIALRLGSSEDSREMLLKPDAAFLPTDVPGRAYFRAGADIELFQVGLVTGEYRPGSDGASQPRAAVTLFVGDQVRTIDASRAAQTTSQGKKVTDLDVLVRALHDAGAACLAEAYQEYQWRPQPIWQPPLPPRLTLADVVGAGTTIQELEPEVASAWSRRPDGDAWLRVELGRMDIPQESRQEPLRINLADGHLAVIGAPGSGKTTLLRTLLLRLALTHSPQDVWCYCIDAGGQGLSPLAQSPHIGSLIQVRDRERIRRLIQTLHMTIRERQDLFRAAGYGDLQTYCREQGNRLPAIVVVIDKLALLREEFNDQHGNDGIVDDLIRLTRVGRPYGIHFVITADAVRDFSYKLLALLDGRIALRLPDIYDYNEVLGGRVSGQISPATPGRALCTAPERGILDVQIALPLIERLDPEAEENDEQATVLDIELSADLKASVARIGQMWERRKAPGAAAPPIELIADQLAVSELGTEPFTRTTIEPALSAALGKESLHLNVARLELNRDAPHALIVGGRRSGKTTALRTCLLALASRYSSADLKFVIVDIHKRGLRAFADLPHCALYATNEAGVEEAVSFLSELRNGGTQGRRWVVVVDDFNIGRTSMKEQFTQQYSGDPNLFSTLGALATFGGEEGIHLLVGANLPYSEDGVIKTLDEGRNGVILWPNRFESGTQWLGLSLPQGERGAELPPGRGLLVNEDGQMIVQIAQASDAEMPPLIAEVARQEAPAPVARVVEQEVLEPDAVLSS
jgi:S-DNA-T family DNA segregation ATPase FtsK/SpoIIIE